MDPLQSHIVLLNDTQFLMSIPNYKVAVQTEFKPRASLICFLKQGALLIRKIYGAFFPGSICGGSHQRVPTGSQVQETRRDSLLCIVVSPSTLHRPSRGQTSMIVFPSDFKQSKECLPAIQSEENTIHTTLFSFLSISLQPYDTRYWLTWCLFSVLKGGER